MEEVLAAIRAELAAWDEAPLRPAPNERIEAVRVALRDAFGATLPPDYAAFLAQADGLSFNGLVLYGSWQSWALPEVRGSTPGYRFWQGLVEVNALWRDGPGLEACLVLGEGDMDLITVDLRGENPVVRDKVSNDVFESFATVEDALVAMLSRRI